VVNPNSQQKIPENNMDESEMSVELGSSEFGEEVSISAENRSQYKGTSKRSVNDPTKVTLNSMGEEVYKKKRT
jgi:hypothetical protein